jgi:hypothetical protein
MLKPFQDFTDGTHTWTVLNMEWRLSTFHEDDVLVVTLTPKDTLPPSDAPKRRWWKRS